MKFRLPRARSKPASRCVCLISIPTIVAPCVLERVVVPNKNAISEEIPPIPVSHRHDRLKEVQVRERVRQFIVIEYCLIGVYMMKHPNYV